MFRPEAKSKLLFGKLQFETGGSSPHHLTVREMVQALWQNLPDMQSKITASALFLSHLTIIFALYWFFFLPSELCVNYARFARIMRSRLGRVAICWRRWTFILFPFIPVFVFLLYVHPRQADDGNSKSVGRIRAKHGLTHRHRLCKKNERAANRLTR